MKNCDGEGYDKHTIFTTPTQYKEGLKDCYGEGYDNTSFLQLLQDIRKDFYSSFRI